MPWVPVNKHPAKIKHNISNSHIHKNCCLKLAQKYIMQLSFCYYSKIFFLNMFLILLIFALVQVALPNLYHILQTLFLKLSLKLIAANEKENKICC